MSKTIGKLREYETVFIINPDLTEDVTNELINRFKEIVTSKGGTMLREDRWGKRKMAYDMKKNPRGHYVLLHFAGSSEVIDEIQRTSHNVDTVIRHMTTLVGPVSDIEAKKAEVEKLVRERNAEKARQEALKAEAEAQAKAEAAAAAAEPEAAPAQG